MRAHACNCCLAPRRTSSRSDLTARGSQARQVGFCLPAAFYLRARCQSGKGTTCAQLVLLATVFCFGGSPGHQKATARPRDGEISASRRSGADSARGARDWPRGRARGNEALIPPSPAYHPRGVVPFGHEVLVAGRYTARCMPSRAGAVFCVMGTTATLMSISSKWESQRQDTPRVANASLLLPGGHSGPRPYSASLREIQSQGNATWHSNVLPELQRSGRGDNRGEPRRSAVEVPALTIALAAGDMWAKRPQAQHSVAASLLGADRGVIAPTIIAKPAAIISTGESRVPTSPSGLDSFSL